MPIQAPQWTEFLSCPVCCNEFAANLRPPISLGCGHTICRTCLATLHRKQCPFDQTIISTDLDNLPVNNALLQLVSTSNTVINSPGNGSGTNSTMPGTSTLGNPGANAIDSDLSSPSVQNLNPDDLQCYKVAKGCIEELALYLKPYPNGNAGGLLSRPMQRKLVTLVNCQLIEDEGRARSLRAARSLGERTVTELILQHQNPQQLSTNLWAAVRARGCQFLGPAMQEEVLKLVLLALEDGSALSRKVLVMFVVQRLEPHFPQASKTSIGHVVQLLYRASCFKVSKREGDSSLMQLKEEFRTYEALRREHDAQIVQIATEAGLRIAPDQWSSLLYGDTAHKSHMQSIIDKLQTPQSFVQSVQELIIALQRTGDPANLSGLRVHLKHLAAIDSNAENHVPSWRECSMALEAVKRVVIGLVEFVQHHGNRKLQEPGHLAHNSKYKISLCRDLNLHGTCPRGSNCTFAHSEDELEKYRTKLRKNNIRTPNGKEHSEFVGDLTMPSGSHGYHSPGDDSSPMRYPKPSNSFRYLDKSPMSSHSHASGSSNSNSSHNSHLPPIPQNQHPSFPNLPPPPTSLQQGANGRNYSFNQNFPSGGNNLQYGTRPPPPPIPPSVHSSGSLRGNFGVMRPPNGTFIGHPPPHSHMQPNPGNGPPINVLHGGGTHPTYPAGQPSPIDQVPHPHMMNAPPPFSGNNQSFSDYPDKIDQRRQFSSWENQPPQPPPPPLPNVNSIASGGSVSQQSLVPQLNLMGQQSQHKPVPNVPYQSAVLSGKTHIPQTPHTQPTMQALPQHQQQSQQNQHYPVPNNNNKYYPSGGALHAKARDFRENKHHSSNNGGAGRMNLPNSQQHSSLGSTMHQQMPNSPYGRNNLHSAATLSQAMSNLTSNGSMNSSNGSLNGYPGGNNISFNRTESMELLKMLNNSTNNELAHLIGSRGDNTFVRSDSLLADDDNIALENEYPGGSSAKYGPISRNALSSKQRDFAFVSSFFEKIDLISAMQQVALGDQSSSNCSSTSSSFYQQQQQQPSHPVASQVVLNKSEPNNNTLDLDFLQVDRKQTDYNNHVLNSGANQTNTNASQLLHHQQQQAEAQLLQHHHYSNIHGIPMQHLTSGGTAGSANSGMGGGQLTSNHHSGTSAAVAAALMSSHHQHIQGTQQHSHHTSPQPQHHHHHHHQQQQQQQQHNQQSHHSQNPNNSNNHSYVQLQHPNSVPQSHSMQGSSAVGPNHLSDPLRFSELMSKAAAMGEFNPHALKELKAHQVMASMSPSSGGVLMTSTPSSSIAAAPLWNNFLDLSSLKPSSSDCSDLAMSMSGHSNSNNSIGLSAANNTILSSSTASNSSISNINNQEDSYEAGIADDMRELALRLESELELDENGV
ncbi:roquin-1 [Uranotaenia lowii]|uniref:roquin-1 n=1 Tax=Uranotaenia lowii TaxID=190385 RepID=UPI002479D195|nr:roquin-1 [Uranotaenia lowii]XP_055602527.1 roquin-1 [Uranotaenia lowii]XP_055602528.1 roquin-1 [Uranotaenia lowii]XP_055602529.1 roquin-1 [Uranotaenia lowii]